MEVVQFPRLYSDCFGITKHTYLLSVEGFMPYYSRAEKVCCIAESYVVEL